MPACPPCHSSFSPTTPTVTNINHNIRRPIEFMLSSSSSSTSYSPTSSSSSSFSSSPVPTSAIKSTASAFQPYTRPPDPFVSDPFHILIRNQRIRLKPTDPLCNSRLFLAKQPWRCNRGFLHVHASHCQATLAPPQQHHSVLGKQRR